MKCVAKWAVCLVFSVKAPYLQVCLVEPNIIVAPICDYYRVVSWIDAYLVSYSLHISLITLPLVFLHQ